MHHTIELDWKVRLLTWLLSQSKPANEMTPQEVEQMAQTPISLVGRVMQRSIATIAQDYKSRHSRATWRYWVEALLPDGAAGGRNSLFSWRWLD